MKKIKIIIYCFFYVLKTTIQNAQLQIKYVKEMDRIIKRKKANEKKAKKKEKIL